jgi:hypothetical protein
MARKKAAPRSSPPSQSDPADAPLVRLRIDGGTLDERYDFIFELSRAGSVRTHLVSGLSGRQVPEVVTRVKPAEVEALRRALGVTKLKQAAARQARAAPKPIPPCSLIGVLEVWDDAQSPIRITFMADRAQAEHAGHPVRPDVRKAVTAIYTRAAKHLGLQGATEIRP